MSEDSSHCKIVKFHLMTGILRCYWRIFVTFMGQTPFTIHKNNGWSSKIRFCLLQVGWSWPLEKTIGTKCVDEKLFKKLFNNHKVCVCEIELVLLYDESNEIYLIPIWKLYLLHLVSTEVEIRVTKVKVGVKIIKDE